MIVGVLKEIKDNENRVAITPKGVHEFVKNGHTVLIEKNAGIGSGISNEEYLQAGAKIIAKPKEICNKAELILKIKEPLPQEYSYFNDKHTLFTYFHFASSKSLTKAMLKSGATCIAYETVQTEDGKTPLLAPMSEVAGKMSVFIGAYYLAKFNSGRGILLSGVSNVNPADVVILGGGFVGSSAAQVAYGTNANVTILEINENRIKELKKMFPNATIVKSTPENIEHWVPKADILIGAVYLAGEKAPHIVSEALVKKMKKGAVIVDVAIDQGGCIETSKPTTHSNPVYIKHNVIHYCVTNMPGAFPRTSTFALTTATLPYALELANKGIKRALKENQALLKGLNIMNGKVTNKGVAEAHSLPYTPAEKLL